MLDENVGSLIGRVTYNMRFGKVVDNKEVSLRISIFLDQLESWVGLYRSKSTQESMR